MGSLQKAIQTRVLGSEGQGSECIVGYSETDATATALSVEFVGQRVSERRRVEKPAAERGMLHSKPVDARKKGWAFACA